MRSILPYDRSFVKRRVIDGTTINLQPRPKRPKREGESATPGRAGDQTCRLFTVLRVCAASPPPPPLPLHHPPPPHPASPQGQTIKEHLKKMTRAPRPKGREVESAGAWRACACFCVCVVQVQRYCLISGVEDGGREGGGPLNIT